MKKAMNCIFFVILVDIMPPIEAMDSPINLTDDSPLTRAIKQDDYEKVKTLLEERKQKYQDYSLNNDAGNFYLQIAIEFGCKNIVELLIACGAQVNAGDCLCRTPLHMAAWWGREEIVVLLLEKSAKVNVQDAFYQTPLHYASSQNYSSIILSLLCKGANSNALVLDGRKEESKAKRRRELRLHINWKSKG